MKQCLNCQSSNVREIFEGHWVYYLCDSCGTKAPSVLEDDGRIRIEKTQDGKIKHYSIAALIRRDDTYLFTKRRRYPFAYHLIAGHVERDDPSPEYTLRREVFEETANEPKEVKLRYSGEIKYFCRAGATRHHFYLYECRLDGELIPNDELEGFRWVEAPKISALEPMSEAAKILFREIGVTDAK